MHFSGTLYWPTSNSGSSGVVKLVLATFGETATYRLIMFAPCAVPSPGLHCSYSLILNTLQCGSHYIERAQIVIAPGLLLGFTEVKM